MVSWDHAPTSDAVASGYTPGPWMRSGCRQKVAGSDTHSVTATVEGGEIIIASVWYDPATHAGFHDARLIAAAPELLEAAKIAEEALRMHGALTDDMERALSFLTAAITKAK